MLIMEHNLCVLVIFPYFCILGVFCSNVKVKDTDFAIPDLGDPLLLTPLLDKGDYKTAQLQSGVKPDLGNVTSFSGFLTVNETCGSNLFFWFFPAEKAERKDAPLVLCVQGGSEASSISALFESIGPFKAREDGLEKREFSWNTDNNLLFIEQFVGVGYSYTKKNCFPEDKYDVVEDLYQAVVQIHKLFPELQGNKFIIAGESFVGHFIPALGHTIHSKNPSAEIKINLSAMMIGNGWMDTVSQGDFADFLYQHGLIDTVGKEEYDHFYGECKKYIKSENWVQSTRYCRALINDLYFKHVGQVNINNYITRPDVDNYYVKYFELPKTRQALHVGNLTFHINRYVFSISLVWDSLKSVKNLVEQLLEQYPIIFYNGQQDIICGYPMMINFLRSLSWSGQDKYLSSDRSKWCIAKNVQTGYFTGSHHLYDVLVLGAGHRVARDQPQLAFQLLSSITSGTMDDPLHGLKDCGFVKLKHD